jgi:putative Ca2+/H+ antiporter (TMEM165/GDT1 family)
MACPLSLEIHHWVRDHWFHHQALAWLTAGGTTFAVIAAAELGDKSQLVCMTLAARHRGLPVFLGALAAFAVLNLAAVVFGAAVAQWFPKNVLALAAALLFAIFGCLALFAREKASTEEVKEKSGHGLFVTTFLMIFLAEFGDKTQLATAAISLTASPGAVWAGSTLALSLASGLGIVAGRTVLQRIPLHLLHRFSGVLFLALAIYAVVSVVPPDTWPRIRERVAETLRAVDVRRDQP